MTDRARWTAVHPRSITRLLLAFVLSALLSSELARAVTPSPLIAGGNQSRCGNCG